MGIKSAPVTFITVAIGVLCAPLAHAAAPALSDYVWDEPTLGFSDCMDRASNALRQVGVLDVRQSAPSNGLGFVGGEVGEYYLGVICMSFKGVVVTQGAGADFNSADKYRQQIDAQMKLGSP